MYEIERKYLVDKLQWSAISKPEPKQIIQGYIHNSVEKTVRIRIYDTQGFLTVKGKTTGISRSEFEYEIPLQDAQLMLRQFADKTISKLRYKLKVGNHYWEVDEFQEKLNGLILAEIELEQEDESFETPYWVTEEVSSNPEFFNARLIEKC
jgi:adenylate cyclase